MTEQVVLEDAPPTPHDILEAGLGEYFGFPVRIAEMTGTSLHGGNDYLLQRLRVMLASGETLSVVFKRLLPDPDPVGQTYLREVLIYRRLLAGGRFGAPALYGSVQDEARDRYWLFVEDVGDHSLEDGDLDDWLAAARWLATLHGTYSGREAELRSLGCLGEHGLRFYRTLAGKARRNLARADTAGAVARFDELMKEYNAIVTELVDRPRTLIHGDLGPHNVAVQPGGRIRPIDWEWAAIGPAAWDLSRLLYELAARATFLDSYLDELDRMGAGPVDRALLADSIRRCDFVYKVWFLSQQPNICADARRVHELLDEMEATR